MSDNELTLRTGNLPVDRALISIEAPMESLLGLEDEGYAIVMDSEVHHRIVACVNAYRGMSTDYLEKVAPGGALIMSANREALAEQAMDIALRERDEASAMSNELLEALKDVLDRIETSEMWWMDCPDRGGFDKEAIQIAIAKAEGRS